MSQDKTTKMLLFAFTVLLGGNLLIALRSSPSLAQGKVAKPERRQINTPLYDYCFIERSETRQTDVQEAMRRCGQAGFRFKTMSTDDDHVVVIMEKELGHGKK